jgi:hypothetical protein
MNIESLYKFNHEYLNKLCNCDKLEPYLKKFTFNNDCIIILGTWIEPYRNLNFLDDNIKKTIQEANLNLTASIENISGVNQTINGTLVASDIYNFSAEADSFTGTINTDLVNVVEGSYITYTGSIDYRRDDGTITTELDLMNAGQIVGMDNAYIDYGYGTVFNNGYGKYHYEENGSFKSKGIRAFMVTKKDTIIIPSASVGGIYTNVLTSSYHNELIIQDIGVSGSLANDPNIIGITTASGYLPSHYIYKGSKHIGLQNLFYKGSKNIESIVNGVTGSLTTIDGKSPVEIFITNPTVLRINKQGRNTSEPILEVD